MTTDSTVVLGRETGVRLLRVVRGFVASEVGGRAIAMAILLVVVLLAINGLNVVNSFVGRDFMTAIERRDGRAFTYQAFLYIAVFAASTLAAVINRFTEERLGLLWREWLTRRLAGLYLDGHVYYELNTAGGLTNPDQRIADDVRAFTTSTLSLALIFLNGTLTVIAFSGVLWSISRLLFATAVAYAALGSFVAFVLGRPLVSLNYDQSDREADFRTQLIQVRENAESIALLGREPQLRDRLFGQVRSLAANLKRIIAVNRNLGFFTTGYNYMIQIIPALIVAPLFIRGSVEFGVIPQSSMAFAQLIGAFSLVVTQFPLLSSYAAVLARLNALGEAADEVRASGPSAIAIVEDPSRFAFEQLSLRSPQDGRPLVQELSLEASAKGQLLVVARGDLVTNALLRAVAGLWHSGSGRVVRPPMGEVLLVAERPYLLPGTLRVSLAGGLDTAATTDDKIWEALRRIGADACVKRVGGLDVDREWTDLLSLEEQRLIGVARLLLAKPRFAVLERPVAGLGAESAANVLAALAESGVATVVLGDGAYARDAFDAVIEITKDGTWTRTSPKETST
jgi:putative ATP-binding cassette transporter